MLALALFSGALAAQQNYPTDIFKDFAPVSIIAKTNYILVAAGEQPQKMAAQMKADYAESAKVIRTSNIRIEQ